MPTPETPRAVLLIACPDRPGIVASTAGFVFEHGGNILDAQQHTDPDDGVFFQRIDVALDRFDIPRAELRDRLQAHLYAFGASPITCEVRFSDTVPRVALLVSKEPHCLHDLLARWEVGELRAELAFVASNHADHADLCGHFGVPYHHLPVSRDSRPEQEAKLRALVDEHSVDLVVLARYMQILSPELCEAWAGRCINIHHSFLPAFVGARPYHQAHQRGVKLIGATAHYVTAELDQGPIIDQDVTRVSHRDGVQDLVRKGRDLERLVLARAVRAHLEHRILVHGPRTVVFD